MASAIYMGNLDWILGSQLLSANPCCYGYVQSKQQMGVRSLPLLLEVIMTSVHPLVT